MQLETPLTTLTAADKRIRELGDKMFELNAQGTCTRALLRAEGFSDHEIDTFGDAARQHANKRFVRKNDDRGQGFTRTDEEIVEAAVAASLQVVTAEQLQTAALASGLSASEIRRNWQRIMRKLGLQVGTLPVPAVQ